MVRKENPRKKYGENDVGRKALKENYIVKNRHALVSVKKKGKKKNNKSWPNTEEIK